MAHSDLILNEIPEINVIIGKNDTGKTGLLKLFLIQVFFLSFAKLVSKNKSFTL